MSLRADSGFRVTDLQPSLHRLSKNLAMTRTEALDLLHEYTPSESLRRHAYAVEASMRAQARRLGADEERWGLVGLLHDFDYERWPEPPAHTREGAKILRERGVDEEIIEAILSHAEWNEIPRDTPLKKALFAVDELSGFITAVAYVRPSRSLAEVTPAAVRKKMKDKAFARAVRREDITVGAELLGLELDEQIALCIQALQEIHEELGL
jgi:putative nucleotidyltransferase with HDIG domain